MSHSGKCGHCFQRKDVALYQDNAKRIVYLCRGCARQLGYR